ncbi:U1 small nuclear ribonucleoprotein 70 kDa-like [Papaver somniferum]|uniref:U1 small nuclear ribonucleoprotein 70 kDa-like n=1 Tax=Papaver somniferum TaxID=3469 RepID=UPI000E7032C6|nr:U1 small nuclear ribonucleoprotein 70 kDa-like [Papaver somniferum]
MKGKVRKTKSQTVLRRSKRLEARDQEVKDERRRTMIQGKRRWKVKAGTVEKPSQNVKVGTTAKKEMNREKAEANDDEEDEVSEELGETPNQEEDDSEEMEENIGEENLTLDQLRETLHRERERDRDLAEQQVQLVRHNARLRQQNRQLNENVEMNAIDSEGNTVSSEEDELRRRRYDHEEDGEGQSKGDEGRRESSIDRNYFVKFTSS